MPKYNHAFAVAFSIESDHPEGEDVTEQMVIDALQARITYLRYHMNEVLEACGVPWDTYKIED